MIGELRKLMEYIMTPPNENDYKAIDIHFDLVTIYNRLIDPETKEMLVKLGIGESTENLSTQYGRDRMITMYTLGNLLLEKTKEYFSNGR